MLEIPSPVNISVVFSGFSVSQTKELYVVVS